jgi:hypothetical protein
MRPGFGYLSIPQQRVEIIFFCISEVPSERGGMRERWQIQVDYLDLLVGVVYVGYN